MIQMVPERLAHNTLKRIDFVTRCERPRGFTLIELITILLLVGILSATVLPRVLPNDTFQLQASRDSVITAFFSAQQLAMNRGNLVQISFSSNGSVFQIDIRMDSDNDTSFDLSERVKVGGIQYPISLEPNQSITTSAIVFNSLGEPDSAQNITLSQSGKNIPITLSATGYAY